MSCWVIVKLVAIDLIVVVISDVLNVGIVGVKIEVVGGGVFF